MNNISNLIQPIHVRIFEPRGCRYVSCLSDAEPVISLEDWLAEEALAGYVYKALVGLVNDQETRIRVTTEYDPSRARRFLSSDKNDKNSFTGDPVPNQEHSFRWGRK